MKKLFRKAVSVLGSAALVGATISGAAAAAYPAPFDSGSYAVVYGSSDDQSAATTLANGLPDMSTGGSLTGGEGVTEDEVVLGGQIDFATSKVKSVMTDSDIPGLADSRFSWDDGAGSDEIDYHEEIIIGDMAVITSLNDEDLVGPALTNNMGLEYRLVFEDALNVTGVGGSDSDDLYLDILGTEYEITAATATTVTVVTSTEYSVSKGDSVTHGGSTYTVQDVSSGAVRVNGETISEGSSKRIDGQRVKVKSNSIFYNENFPEDSSLTLQIGDDIEKTFTSGEEFVGEDEDDPLWTWDIAGLGNSSGSYIGIQYNVNINDADDEEAGDSIKYIGDAYVFPNNFAQVSLDGLTDVDYEDIKVSFTEKDLYNSSDSGTANEDEWVIQINAENTDSITVGAEETDEIYIWFANNASTTQTGVGVPEFGALEIFYRDHDGDNTPANRARYETRVNLTADGTLARTNFGTIEVGDTTVDLDISVASGIPVLSFENPDDGDINLTIGGTAIADGATTQAGQMKQLGTTIDDADANDVVVAGTDVSTKEESIMDYYGIIVARDVTGGVEGGADKDEVTLSIPDDQVYALVSATAGGASSGDSGQKTYMDSESSDYAGKNIVVVGGSCVNDVAASLLGGAHCGDAFTAETTVGPGQFLIETFDYNGKVATLVAGYERDDTAKAATYLANDANAVNTNVGDKYVGTSAEQTAVMVS